MTQKHYISNFVRVEIVCGVVWCGAAMAMSRCFKVYTTVFFESLEGLLMPACTLLTV